MKKMKTNVKLSKVCIEISILFEQYNFSSSERFDLLLQMAVKIYLSAAKYEDIIKWKSRYFQFLFCAG